MYKVTLPLKNTTVSFDVSSMDAAMAEIAHQVNDYYPDDILTEAEIELAGGSSNCFSPDGEIFTPTPSFEWKEEPTVFSCFQPLEMFGMKQADFI